VFFVRLTGQRLTEPFTGGYSMANLSGLTDEQAKEFHEHWKHGVWSWVMIASAVHVVTWIYQPWF
jgi:light-harvesting complex 1 beta chain